MRKSKYVDAVQVIYDNKILAQTVTYQLAIKGIWSEPNCIYKFQGKAFKQVNDTVYLVISKIWLNEYPGTHNVRP